MRFLLALTGFLLAISLQACGGGGSSSTSPPSTSQKSVNLGLQAGASVSQFAGAMRSYPIDAIVQESSTSLVVSIAQGPVWAKITGSSGKWVLELEVPATVPAGIYQLTLDARTSDGSSFAQSIVQVEVLSGTAVAKGVLTTSSGGFQSDSTGNYSFGVAPNVLTGDLTVEMIRAQSADGLGKYQFTVNRGVSVAELAAIKVSIPLPTASSTSQTAGSMEEKSLASKAVYAGATRLAPENYALRAGAGGGRLPIKSSLSLLDILDACGITTSIPNPLNNLSIAKDLIFRSCLEEFVASESWTIRNSKNLDGSIKPAILFVHGFGARAPFADGLGGTTSTWGNFPIVAAEIGSGFSTHEFRWYTDARFEDAADDLAHVILKLRQITGKPVTIVAHSFGGVLTRTLLQGLSETKNLNWDRSVSRVITLGSPHSGILDQAGTVSGVALPKGQDPYAIQQFSFNMCKAITCHQAGELVSFTAALTAVPLKYSLFDISANQGELIARLSNLSTNPLPTNIPFTIGIGLTTDRNAAGTLDVGDALISYEGQRFHPSYRTSKAHAKCDDVNAPTVRETLIASPLDRKPGQLPFDDWVVFQTLNRSAYKSYKHSGFPPSLDLQEMATTFGVSAILTAPYTAIGAPVSGAFAATAQEIWRNRGVFSEANVSCTSAASCDHDSFLLVKRALTDASSSCARTEPTTAPIAFTLSVPVLNASSKQGIANAKVILRSAASGSLVAEALTNTSGIAAFSLQFSPNAKYLIEVQAQGFDRKTGATHLLASTAASSSNSSAPVLLTLSSGSRFGQIGISAINALSGSSVGTSVVTIRRNGVPVAGPYSLNAGAVVTHSVPSGKYEVTVSATGYITETASCEAFALSSNPCTISLRPVLDSSTALIRLTWDADPQDLDSHLWRYNSSGTLRDHIYYLARNAINSQDNLDLDDTTSYGPETTTIKVLDTASRYVFAVYHYSGSGSITSTSLAQVKVQIGSQTTTYSAPTVGTGYWWKVFEIQNGVIIPCASNCISNTQPN